VSVRVLLAEESHISRSGTMRVATLSPPAYMPQFSAPSPV